MHAKQDKLEISFATPLKIALHKPEPEPSVKGRFSVQIGNLKHSGENMAENFTLAHYYTVSVEWVDYAGNTATVDGPTTWTSTDPSVLTCTVSTGNPLIANCQALAVGTAQVRADADADMGGGVVPVTSTLDVNVIKGQAVAGKMNVTDMGSGPPPAA